MTGPGPGARRGSAPAGSAADDPGVAAYYLAVNRNKRSLRLDLKTEAGPRGAPPAARPGRRPRRELPGRRVRGLGFGDDVLEALNPRLVHLAISGYGPTGPEAAKPGYDFVIQAVSGLMSITGWPDEAGGEPTKVGVAIADVVTGLHGAVAVLAALAGRDRRRRDRLRARAAGRGQRIDVSILESALAVLVNQAQNAFATGTAPVRRGNAHPNIVPYETFATADGEIAVAVGSERQWERFCAALDLAPGWRPIGASRRTPPGSPRGPSSGPILADRLASEPSAVWLARLEAAEVPSGPINDLVAALVDRPGPGPRAWSSTSSTPGWAGPPGRPAVPARATPGVDPVGPAAARRARRRAPCRARVRRRRTSPACAPTGSI